MKVLLVFILIFSVTKKILAGELAPAPVSDDRGNPDIVSTYKRMSLEELMAQEVTSVARQPEPYGQAPAAIQVVTSEQIRRSGATSIPEALRLADNLNVAQSTSSQWDISARGFNTSGFSDKLLVLMDGRAVYSPLLAGVIWNMQDYLLEDLDRIEVISGPGGTLWGANAVNGVINIISKSAKDTQGFYLETGGGNQLEDFVGMRYGGMISTNVYYRVYGKYFDRGAEVFADGRNAHDAWNRGQGGFRIDAEPSAANAFTLQGDLFGGNNDVVPGGEGTPKADGTTAGGNLLGRWKRTFTDEADLSVQIYYDRTHLAAPFQGANLGGPVIPPGTLYDDLDTVDFDLQHRFALGNLNKVVWGFGYRFTHDQVQGAPLVTFLPERFDRNLFSGFVQDEIRLLRDVYLTMGTKLEHNDYTGFEYEPSARLRWQVTDQQMLWGAVSRSVRMPARYDRDLFEPSPAYGSFLGATNSNFQSETVIAYELGYRTHFIRQASASFSAFYNMYDRLRSLSATSPNFVPLYWANNLEGDTYGFELSADYQINSWWQLHGGYDFLREDIRVKSGRVDLDQARNETADPENQLFLRSSMDLPGRMEVDGTARWIDSVRNNQGSTPGGVPAYAELDLRWAWHATRNLEFSIVGQNLLHDHHPEAGFPNSSQESIVRGVVGKIAMRW